MTRIAEIPYQGKAIKGPKLVSQDELVLSFVRDTARVGEYFVQIQTSPFVGSDSQPFSKLIPAL